MSSKNNTTQKPLTNDQKIEIMKLAVDATRNSAANKTFSVYYKEMINAISNNK